VQADGLAVLVRAADYRVVDSRPILFNDCADRVAQLVHIGAPAVTPHPSYIQTAHTTLPQALPLLGSLCPTPLCRDVYPPRQALSAGGSGGVEGAEHTTDTGKQAIIVNTHLLFPYNSNSTIIQLRESMKVTMPRPTCSERRDAASWRASDQPLTDSVGGGRFWSSWRRT
jgi:hypothetical protein